MYFKIFAVFGCNHDFQPNKFVLLRITDFSVAALWEKLERCEHLLQCDTVKNNRRDDELSYRRDGSACPVGCSD